MPVHAIITDVVVQGATATGIAGAAVTLTLAAPGVGLRQYLTGLEVTRSASAALTASATPVVVTTTGLSGVLEFTFGSDAAGIGVDKTVLRNFALALGASALNTAVSVVCPAVDGVIWRVTATYYVAP